MNIKPNLTTKNRSEAVCEAVLYVLSYYAMFHYPLTVPEIMGNCSVRCTTTQVKQCLDELCLEGKVFEYNGLYSANAQVETLAKKRLEANRLAAKKLREATYAGRFIGHFPFVRFVGISGSLSKGYADKHSDFDFFVVTAENRLWVCRTVLHLFKKLTFLFGQQHKFCMNYFIDVSQLKIEEQNIYTAIELSGLVPVTGKKTHVALMDVNKAWIKNYLPNGYHSFYAQDRVANGVSLVKFAAEIMLHPAGAILNRPLMKLTDSRWRKKWTKKNYPSADYDLAFKTTLHQSKNHPANFQKKILAQLKNERAKNRI